MDFQHWNLTVALLLNLFKNGYLCTAVASGVDAVSVCEQENNQYIYNEKYRPTKHRTSCYVTIAMHTSRYRCWNDISCSPNLYTQHLTGFTKIISGLRSVSTLHRLMNTLILIWIIVWPCITISLEGFCLSNTLKCTNSCYYLFRLHVMQAFPNFFVIWFWTSFT